MYLKIYFLSDVTDIKGRSILPSIRSLQSDRDSKWEWPNQQLPKKCDQLWKRVCSKLYQRLQTHRLGVWYQQNQIWKWKTDMTQQFLEGPEGVFSKTEGRYGVYYEPCAPPDNILFYVTLMLTVLGIEFEY